MKYDYNLNIETETSQAYVAKLIKNNSFVLELGTANGKLTRYLNEAKNCKVYGVELNEADAIIASQFTEDFYVGNIEDLKWIDKFHEVKFDFIVLGDVLEHLRDPQSVLDAAKKLLNQDGRIFISVPNVAHNAIIMGLMEDEFNYSSTGLLDETHIKFFTKKSLEKMVCDSGLFIEKYTAIFREPELTEFKRKYDNFPSSINSYLQKRKYGLVYQYLAVVCATNVDKEESFSKVYLSELFYNIGDGYNEHDKKSIAYDEFCNKFDFNLRFDINQKVYGFRFDLASSPIQIEKVRIIIDGEDYLGAFSHNGNEVNGSIVFNHYDPYIIIDFADGINLQRIEFITFGMFHLKYDSCDISKFEYDSLIKTIENNKLEIEKLKREVVDISAFANSLGLKNRFKKLIKTVIKKFLPKSALKLASVVKNNPRLVYMVINDIKEFNVRSLLYKLKMARSCLSEIKTIEGLEYFEDLMEWLDTKNHSQNVLTEKIDIIIPIYNGREYLSPLFDSIIKNTNTPYRLLLVEDCSTDKEVKTIIVDFLSANKDKDIVYIQNEINLGFVKSVNKAVELVKNHFVILNTDVEVPHGWLSRLIMPIMQNDDIASTTPFTNSGTICSFPKWLENNELYCGMDLASINESFKKIRQYKHDIVLPTGVGFCMGVNKSVVEKIGFFDELHFGKGYGEENDWCVRANDIGYKNILVPNIFVYHKHGGSFESEQKQQLQKENMATLLSLHPDYNTRISEHIRIDPTKGLRNLLELLLLCDSEVDGKPIIVITHKLGGGSGNYINDRFGPSSKVFTLSFDNLSKDYILDFSYKDKRFSYKCRGINVLNDLVNSFNCQELHINQLVSFPDVLESLKIVKNIIEQNQGRLKTYIYVHDYFCVCPSFNLLDSHLSYCNVPDDKAKCMSCLRNNRFVNVGIRAFNSFKNDISIDEWRTAWSEILLLSEVLCFSQSSKEILVKTYSELSDSIKFVVKPHTVDWLTSEQKVTNSKSGERVKIAIVGHLTIHKGINQIRKLSSYIDKYCLPVDLVVFGEVQDEFPTLNLNVKVIGTYQRKNLPTLLRSENIDLAFVPSVCPETFSYTTEELIKLDVPIIVYNLGAPAERVATYHKGIVINDFETESVIKAIETITNKLFPVLNENKKSNNKICCVVNDFHIYQSVIESSRFMNDLTVTVYDNTNENIGISKRYNDFIEHNLDNDCWLILCHHDFAFLEDIDIRLASLDKSKIYGPIGATKIKNQRVILGQINQGHNGKICKHGLKINSDQPVDTVDCMCMVIHTSLLKLTGLRFDENLTFHHYAEDFCLNALINFDVETHVFQTECLHTSYGVLSKSFFDAVRYVKTKYNGFEYQSTCPLEE